MILIKNVEIVGFDKDKRDILIDAKRIKKISRDISVSDDVNVIDADGLVALSGIVDLNVRVKDDQLNIKNLDTLYNKSIKGGVTTFVLSPRFSPLMENQTFNALLSDKLSYKYPTIKVAIKALVDDNRLNNISTLIKRGINIVQENSDINGNLLRRIYEYSKMHKNIFFVFCENEILNDSGVMNEGELSFELGLPGISKIGEISEVAKVVQMSKHYDVPTLFQAISTTRAIDIIYESKDDFQDLYSEVSIHHLVLDESNCDNFNTYAKLNPPLRTTEDKTQLLKRLQDGKVDILTSLHSAKSVVYKDVAFFDAKYGIDCIEDYLSICYTYLVKENKISFEKLSNLLSEKPAEILGYDGIGKIEEGYYADIILFDKDVSKKVEKINSPYCGTTLYGEIKSVFSKGIEVTSTIS